MALDLEANSEIEEMCSILHPISLRSHLNPPPGPAESNPTIMSRQITEMICSLATWLPPGPAEAKVKGLYAGSISACPPCRMPRRRKRKKRRWAPHVMRSDSFRQLSRGVALRKKRVKKLGKK